MTGWRCGWAVGPAAVIAACNALQSHSTSNVCSITQKAVVAALRGPQDCVTEMLDEYRRRRDQLYALAVGGSAHRPASSRRARSTCSPTSPSSCRPTASARPPSWRTALLDDAHVALTPGEAFDAPGFLRISYATSMKELERGSQRILEFLADAARASGAACRLSSLDAASTAIVGAAHVRTDDGVARDLRHRRAEARPSRRRRGRCPASTAEVAAIVRALRARTACRSCRAAAAPATPAARCRCAAASSLSLERMNRILEIDEANLARRRRAQRDHRRPAGRGREASGCSIRPIRRRCATSAIGGNVAECAGGPRAFKYGTTKQYVLGLEAVLPTGEIIETGGKVGQERRRLRPDAPARRIRGDAGDHHARSSCGWCRSRRCRRRCARRSATIEDAVQAVSNVIRARVVPAALELIDGDSLEAVAQYLNVRSLAPEGTGALLLLEVDGVAGGGRGGGDALRAGLPRRRRDRGPARARRGRARRSCGACAASCRSSLQDDRAAQVQPRRRRAEGPDPGAVRRWSTGCKARVPACASRASATPATATSTSTSWSTPGDEDEMRARPRGRARAVRRRRRARGIDQRRARHRLREGAVPAARARRRTRSR